MTDRFVTVPDSLELPAAVKVPVARLIGPTGAAATPADIGAATSAQGALGASASQPGHTHTLDATTDTATRVAMTPAERTKLTNTSGTNTGDQTLPTWTTLADKPAVIAAGATQADARAAIGAGTPSLAFDIYPGTTKAGFIAKASEVAATGRTTLRVAPGTYDVPDIHPDDVSNLYLVGDGVTLTGTPYPNLYPFTSAEWVGRASARANEGSQSGVIAFELDDALPIQWQKIFPVTKELGIGIGVSWPTGNGARWIKEAWRHGWEIMAHGHNHETFGTIPIADVETICQQSVAAISAITGSAESIALIYPEHSRNAETDRVCSKYFIRGRGQAGGSSLSRDTPNPWMTSAYFLDSAYNEDMKRAIDAVARTNGRLVFYCHAGLTTWQNTADLLRQITRRARALGVRIDLPSNVYPSRRLTPDAYFELDPTKWSIPAPLSLDTERAYKGTSSVKFTAATSGTTHGTLSWPQHIPHASRPGRFGVYRASFRYWADSTITMSTTYGARFGTAGNTVGMDGLLTTGPLLDVGAVVATSLPAAQWDRKSAYFILGPDIVSFSPVLKFYYVAANSVFWLDEVKLDAVRSVSSLSYTATLNGTAGVKISTGLYRPAAYPAAVTPLGAVAGRLYVTAAVEGDTLTVYSTDAADVGQTVRVTISAAVDLPALAATGA